MRCSRFVARIAVAILALDAGVASAQQLSPLVYAVSMPAPESHYAEIELSLSAGPGPSFELMMPVWSPGYYRIEDYAANVSEVRARTAAGRPLEVERTQKNRWRIHAGGSVAVSYRVFCNQRSVTTNYVGADYAVLNGAPTFMTLVEPPARRPHEVRLSLPAAWTAMSGMPDAPGGRVSAFRADSYETLVDSPILAGSLGVRTFDVAGKMHYVVSAGDKAAWDAEGATADLKKFVEQTYGFWGFLPYDKYVFLLVLRQGGGGLEHMNSTLSTVSALARESAAGERGPWVSLGLLAHEHFHLFNAKRLRPVELGPFDFEKPPTTASLWIAEGVTSYYSDLLLTRARLRTPAQHLASLSNLIGGLQNAPGRLLQSVEESSRRVWDNSNSGINPSASTVSYYNKGNVLGLLLDARIRRATGGRRSLDDVMKLAYQRYSGVRGFTADEFRATAEEVAGTSLRDWFRSAVSSTEELDYTDVLEWYGLRFTTSSGRAGAWQIERRADATDVQTRNLEAWLRSDTPQVAAQTLRPNIVLMFPDNLGWGEVGAYGGVRGQLTPRIDTLAAEGIRLNNFNVEFSCTVSRAALMTGRYAIRTGATQAAGIALWEITIAEALKSVGYATALFGKWHIGGDRPEGHREPAHQGFDEYYGIPRTSNEAQTTIANGQTVRGTSFIWEGKTGEATRNVKPFDLDTRRTIDRESADRGIAFMERNVRERTPFFLYYPITQIHFPTLPHPDFAGRTGAGDIGDAMAEMDATVGRLLDTLDRLAISRDTIVLWCTDNGAEQRRPWRGSSGPWSGFYNTVMEGGIRTPCIVRWPGRIPAGRVSNEIVHEVDLFPTLAAAAGADVVPKDRAIDGVNQLPFLEGKQSTSNRDAVLFFANADLRAVKWHDWKLHYTYLPEAGAPPVPPLMRLFNLRSDPKEETDIKDANPWAQGAMDRIVAAFTATIARYPHVPPGAADPYEPPKRD